MMKNRIVALVLSMCILLCGFVGDVSAEGNTDNVKYLYVSNTGNDTAAGSIEEPLKSFSGAKKRIRALKRNSSYSNKSFVVYFREGEYRFSETLTMDKGDSGLFNAIHSQILYH